MRSPGTPTSPAPFAGPRPSHEPHSPGENVEHSFHNGRAIEVVTAALPSGGFVILHIRVLDVERRQWVRVSSGSFWSFDSQTAAARHGRALAVFAITNFPI